MNKSYEMIISLLQNALWNSEVKVVADCNWGEIEDIIQKHKIGSIFASINSDAIIPKGIKDRWIATAAYQVVKNKHMLADQDIMLQLLADSDISAVIIKGAASSQYYHYPELRTMGDVDFVVPREKFEEAYKILSTNGFSTIHKH